MRQLDALNIRDLKHLCRHLKCSREELRKLCQFPERHYCEFTVEVKGKVRPISQPVGRLRAILDNLNDLLQRIRIPDYLHGGIRGHSPITNARCHVGKVAAMKFDLEAFFPSVRHWRVYSVFRRRLGCSPDVSRILTRLVTLHGSLPQGSPTSTIVANLVLLPVARRINILAESHRADYSQYVDDGTISGPGYLERLRPLVDKIVRQESLRTSPKPSKRVTQYWHEEQTTTGVRVNTGIDVPSQKVKDVRAELVRLRADIRRGKDPQPRQLSSLRGKIQHITGLNRGAGKSLMRRLRAALGLVGKIAP